MTSVSLLRLHERFAVGTTASVHFGTFAGPARLVAVKRLHPNVAADEAIVTRILDEARLAMRVDHPNVVATLDVTRTSGELLTAMEYVAGASVAEIAEVIPGGLEPRIACAIAADALRGFQAAHEARASRDVSPRRVLVGADGRARVIAFGARVPTARGVIGALPYTPPERIGRATTDLRHDVWATSVVLWETLTGRALFRADTASETLRRILTAEIPPPSRFAPWIAPKLDAIVVRGLARNPVDRFPSPAAMALELEGGSCATPVEVARAIASMDLPCVRLRRSLAQRARLHLE